MIPYLKDFKFLIAKSHFCLIYINCKLKNYNTKNSLYEKVELELKISISAFCIQATVRPCGVMCCCMAPSVRNFSMTRWTRSWNLGGTSKVA